MQRVFGVLLLTVQLLTLGRTQDPCTDFNSLGDIDKRDSKYQVATGESRISDRSLTEGWYDVDGRVLLDSAPGFQHCGTLYPIWRKEKNGDTSLMCLQDAVDTCYKEFNINTKMCGTTERYHLLRTPDHSSAYCFAYKKGDEPPDFVEKPTVAVRLIDNGINNELEFSCEFDKHPDDLFYRTYWVVDGVHIDNEGPSKWEGGHVIKKQVLTEEKLKKAGFTKVGFEVRCSVRASKGVDKPSSTPHLSDPKFIGIKMSPETLVLSEGEKADITLQLTVPFGCGQLTECDLQIEGIQIVPKTCNACGAKLVSTADCGAKISSRTWNKPVSIAVHGQISQTYGKTSQVQKLRFRTRSLRSHLFWDEYDTGFITVQLTKNTKLIEKKSCHAVNDPHMKTFDGSKYEHQYQGVFTLYKHKSLPVEVQLKTAVCARGSRAFCNCGVAVRAGKTVFEFNRCKGQSTIWILEYTLCGDGGDVLQVKRKGPEYKVILPTGGSVSVAIKGNFLNVYVYPSVQDVQKSSGLCGLLSSTTRDDFVKRDGTTATNHRAFSDSWRVGADNNLFNHDTHGRLTSWPKTLNFCSCRPKGGAAGNQIQCTAAQAHEEIKTLPGFTDVPPSKCSITERRKRRSVLSLPGASPPRGRRQVEGQWRGGWTEDKARAYCEDMFHKSRSMQACGNVPEMYTNDSLANCVMDIQLTGTTDFSQSAVDTVTDHCIHEVVVNPVLWEQTQHDDGMKSVYDMVMAEACPSDCSGNGNCVQGNCDCETNFSGTDCSVDLTIPPRLMDLDNGGTCDMSRGVCNVTSLDGDTFVDGVSTCSVEELRVRQSGQNSVATTTSTATVESISRAKCNIVYHEETESDDEEYVRAFRISVGNSADIFSNSVGLMVYDGSCVRASVEGDDFKWDVEGPYCVFRGTCVPHGTGQPGNPRKVCQVSDNTREWTYTSGCSETISSLAALMFCLVIGMQ